MAFKWLVIIVVLQLLFLIPSFYIYRRLIKKYLVKRIRLYSLILTLVLPFIYSAILISGWMFIVDPIIRSKKFETKEWVYNINSRYRMINDLIENDLLIGKTKNEVIEILGGDYKENCWNNNTFCYVTYDPDNYALLDHYEFVVLFGKDGLVKKVSSQII